MKGFTLIEVLVAVAIVAIIAAGLFGTFSRAVLSRDIAQDSAARFADGRRALDWIESDLSGLYDTGSFADGFADTPPRFHADGDPVLTSADEAVVVLDFTAVSSRSTTPLDGLAPLPAEGLDRGDLVRIVYRLEPLPEPSTGAGVEAGAALVRYEIRPPLPEIVERGARSVVLPEVHALSLRMRAPRGTWRTDWETAGGTSAEAALPLLVETRFSLVLPSGGEQRFRSTAYLAAAARP